jgi:hypothetical protein
MRTSLRIEGAWHRRPTYPDQVGALDIYTAVIDDGVHTPRRFAAWLVQRGLPDPWQYQVHAASGMTERSGSPSGRRACSLSSARHDVNVDDIGQRAHAAIVAGDWNAVRPLLHPYLHWTDSDGRIFRGRSKVLAMLEQAVQPRPRHSSSSCGMADIPLARLTASRSIRGRSGRPAARSDRGGSSSGLAGSAKEHRLADGSRGRSPHA